MKGNIAKRIVAVAAFTALLAYSGPARTSAAGAGFAATRGTTAAPAGQDHSAAASLPTTTPIKHLVVIFQENVSFDHYFGTYPNAANPPGEPAFMARGNTPAVNGLTPDLLTNNPNTVQPFRLDRTQPLTCDQSHTYTAEQQAEDGGAMDKFVQYTEGKATKPAQYCPDGTVMGYYDGNTVTALWNYAQHFAMSDNSFGTLFGPSTPGALNLAATDTAGAACGPSNSVYNSPGTCSATTPPSTTDGPGTVYRDTDPYYDDCSSGGPNDKSKTIALTAPNIGELLTGAGLPWGWFEGGFADCTAKHPLIAADVETGVDPSTDTVMYGDYSPHHDPFQYVASTSNPHHLPPSSDAMIGLTDQANHQYDLSNFWTAADQGNLPAVSYLKAPGYQDGHAGSSDPLDEQEFLVDSINHIMSLPSWKSTAIIVQYDDSDGWYDHVRSPIVNHSDTPLDSGCGDTNDGTAARCGYGPRLPYLVISPYARDNYVDPTLIDQSSTARFIEDNWLGGERLSSESFDNRAGSILGMFDFSHPSGRRLFLDSQTGTVLPDDDAPAINWSDTRPRGRNNTVTVVAAGDIACDPASPHFNGGQGDASYCHEKATSDLIAAAQPDAVLALGDLQYGGGTLDQFERSYGPSWGQFKAMTYPIPGNEDYATPGAAGYFSYFGGEAGNNPGGYYSFDLGAWHIIALNSQCDEPGVGGCGVGSPQERWLVNDLATHRSACTLAMFHEPRFTSGKNGNHPELQALWDDLYAYGTDIVLNGHDHIYERFAPQTPQQKADPRGIREFIVGTGGNNHQPHFGTPQPNKEVLDNTTYGILQLTLGPGSYDWQFIPDHQAGNGTLTDSGHGSCHGFSLNETGPRAMPLVSHDASGGLIGRFAVDFQSTAPGQGYVLFGTGPGCTGLTMTATQDQGAGTTQHALLVTGDDLTGASGDVGILPGTTYWYETATMTESGLQVDNNGGKCYSVTLPSG